ncbi:metallophosphoesterase [Methanosarcinales archaeon]|nr:MAG: metallophosphoesterase [Methanosarcinales archaeon]RLG28627.1 MAG: metallophosphoesterase [Methanosarcinales archaeon]HHI30885.1 YfcE family phosphodiesterase [Candidatus Methanoperedenaceae archaeon]
MKTVIAIADTHVEDEPIRSVLPRGLIDLIEESDLLVHAGSFTSVRAYEEFAEIGELVAVSGAEDCVELRERLDDNIILNVEGLSVGVVHSGRYVSDAMSMGYLASEMGVDLLIHGYLHRPRMDRGDITTICPGSPTNPRMSIPSAMQISIDGEDFDLRLIVCSGRICEYINAFPTL